MYISTWNIEKYRNIEELDTKERDHFMGFSKTGSNSNLSELL